MTTTNTPTSEILTNWQKYRSEMMQFTQLTHTEERELVERARAGDEQAKYEMI